MKKNLIITALFSALIMIAGCKKTAHITDIPERNADEQQQEQRQADPAPLPPSTVDENTAYYVNYFMYNVMGVYYLWNAEINSALAAWKQDIKSDPTGTIERIRYKDSKGKDIDRWTQAISDFKEFTDYTDGTSKTNGFDFSLFYTDQTQKDVCAVINYITPDSPAAKAGLKRGDAIGTVNGKVLTVEQYYDIVLNEMLGGEPWTGTLLDVDKTFTIEPVKMYEDPVLLYKVFNCNGKKVAYLHYTSFTLKSYARLIEAFKYFKKEGAEELILDFRYNGGGYVIAEDTLASMIAPESAVFSGSVFETSVYNALLTSELGNDAQYFKTEFTYTDEDKSTVAYSTVGYNLSPRKVYAILTGGSASASESILCGLMPYVDVKIYGEQSHGKYCTGIMYSANDWYDDYKSEMRSSLYNAGKTYADNWGIYVMIARYADKNGNTPCMPDGFIPDVPVDDDPNDSYDLGDPNETMLKAVLTDLGYKFTGSATKATAAPERKLLQHGNELKPSFGMRIANRLELDK